MNQDPTRTCAVLIDLPDMVVLRADREGSMLSVHVKTLTTVIGCPSCGVVAGIKGRVRVSFCDLPVYCVSPTLIWLKWKDPVS